MQAAAPSRSLRLAGATNFRDLGGYAGHQGRTVRWRRLLRSDHLARLTDEDIATLGAALGPGLRVCDLRGVAERETAACIVPGAVVHSLPIEPTIVQRLNELVAGGHRLTAADTVALMQDTYRGFVRQNTPRFAALFTHLLAPTEAPLVFHCTAGKDRTGFAAALVLSALGVPREVVVHDFLLTNDHLRPHADWRGDLPEDVTRVLWGVQAPFLEAAWAAVEEDFGSMDGYLRDGLGVGAAERERLHATYLQA